MKKVSLLVTILILLMGSITGCGANEQSDALGFTIPSKILETKESVDEDILYYVPNENMESDSMSELTSFHGNFLLSGFSSQMTEDGPENMGFHLQMFSPATGEIVSSTDLSDMEFPNLQDCGEYLAVTDWSDGKILLLDENLQEISNYQVESDYNSMYVSPEADRVYVFTPDQGLQITNLSSGKQEVMLEDTVNLFVSNECGSVITFSYTNKKTLLDEYGAIDLRTGKLLEFPFDGSFFDIKYVNNTWMATSESNTSVYYIGNKDDIKIFESTAIFDSVQMNTETGNLMFKHYDEDGFLGISVYDIDGKFISQFKNNIKGADVSNELIWSEGDQGFFFSIMGTENDMLMFWDMSAEISGTDLLLQPVPVETLPEEAVSQELYTFAKAIGYKHGIEIRIADQMDEDYMDFKVEENLDEQQIKAALDILGDELLIYPEGYFSQLLHGSVREIEIHLAGALTSLSMPEEGVNGFTSYSGFAQTRDGKAVLVLDVHEGENMRNFVHHELFHLLDDKLAFNATIRENAIYSEEKWTELNPEGFEYADSTFVLPDEIYNEEYDLWFIDLYSRTMAREDRARIMEYAMIGDYNMFIEAPYRQAKLEYLNQCIRDAFDTTGWPEITVWEETLEKSYSY